MRAKLQASGLLGRLHSRVFRRVHRDERGHVAILYAVCMLFVSALVFFVIAAGKRYLQKETIQAAVDAASFAGAAAEAKTLNTIAFCNLVLAIGIAIVYTLQALFAAIVVFIGIIVGLEASTLGLYCIGDAPDCVEVDSGLAEEIAARYEEASIDLANRLKPIAHAAQELAKAGPILMLVEAEESSTLQEAYVKRLPGLIVATDPLKPVLPVEDGRPDQICGPEPERAANGAALAVEGLLDLPAEIPPEGKAYIAAAFIATDIASGLGVCGGEFGIRPQTLTLDWEKTAPVKAVAYLSDSKPGDRRAYMAAAAAQYGGAPETTANFMLATSEASVYGFDGTKGEDLWHMDWQARLVLSQAKDFGPLKVLAAGPIGQILKSVWIH
jgi:hypothetical protein